MATSGHRSVTLSMSRIIVVVGLLVAWARPAVAEVFHSRESALALAFKDADRVEPKTLFLTETQRGEIERRSGSAIESRMISYYVGIRGSAFLGYAFFDTHVVRTLPETFMVVLGPSGTVQSVHILAFHEPTDYLPPARWLAQFSGRVLTPGLAVNRDIAGIAGSSLSVQAVTMGVRRILALWPLIQRSNETSN